VPEAVTFATKPQLAQRMLERALAAGVPAAWVTGDSIYGGDRRLRVWLEQQEHPFVLAVTSDEPWWAVLDGRWGQPRADVLAAQIPADVWQRLSAGDGAKRPRWYEWARVRLARLHLTAQERRWDHWLLVRRSRRDPTELAYYVVFAPAGTTLRTLARVAGHRWRIEQSFELAKGEVGLDQYAVRRWDGWYRHMTLAMFALAYLAVLRAHLFSPPPMPSDGLRTAQPAPQPGGAKAQRRKARIAKGGPTSARSI
jgi:SRSO17 transposase